MNPTADLPIAHDKRHRAENFPVASWLCPAKLRPPILAIYRFARLADDIADEGDANPVSRQAALDHLRDQLRQIEQGRQCEALHEPLSVAVRDWQLPTGQLHALLDAFEQDTRTTSYATRDDLLAYCQHSANPVGRLLLHLAGVSDPTACAQSDAICSALQLINFWQDVSLDRLKGRVYIPKEDLHRHGADVEAVLSGHDGPAVRAALRDVTAWAMNLMAQGSALPRLVPGRLGWELRAVIEGGLRVAEKITALDYATLTRRPRLRAWDSPLLLWRTLRQFA